ncbi:M20/M25/M40 family metallo-hydrolase [Alkalicoccus daliensis]|uniref:D-alanine-D-alanine ligase n=1 Tax=Alkalicoccus daliensis TaxID=745820 RepID=A0A1H0KKD8_9BACI|nr:M20/M25/M40 family metallo-hydrolase [Alkalicoccus daliensis]SDO56418.1 D-alanine-D-alanine ligase [Alkalicoccus daliensis]
MKIAVVYNRESQAVINLFGTQNREKYGLETIKRIKDGLKKGGHEVKTFEGDKNLIQNLEDFMPSVISGERPGLVFNLSYGIQGRGRYMHVPGMLEMLGIPYVGSGPETHALALDKVVTKIILLQQGLPTPKFAVLDKPDSPLQEDLKYPLIVKPKDEAVSFGLRIVNNDEELREGIQVIYDTYNAPTLVEEYISGREVNVGLLGNGPTEALPPVELVFGKGPQIFTYEDKKNESGRTVEKVCPAPLTEEETARVKELAVKTFEALNCYDSARVDFRIDEEGNPYILEVNSMASLGKDGSFVFAAEKVGYDYPALMNKIIDVTCERYFGADFFDKESHQQNTAANKLFQRLTTNRGKLEADLKSWTNLSSRTEDAVGLSSLRKKLAERLTKLSMQPVESFTNGRSAWTWESKAGMKDGTLLVIPIDVPGARTGFPLPFRKEQEWIYGEGVASSRGGITITLAALQALKEEKQLSKAKVGIFFYADEGRGMRYSAGMLEKAAAEAKEVIVMQPGFVEGKIVDQRRGSKQFHLIVEGDPERIGKRAEPVDVLSWFLEKTGKLNELNSRQKKIAVAVQDLRSERYSVLTPHRVSATIAMTYIDEKVAEKTEEQLRSLFKASKPGMKTYIELLTERPPLLRKKDHPTLQSLERWAKEYQLPFGKESSLLATAAGVIPAEKPVICGFAPASKKLFTPNEALHRSELVQRSVLLALQLQGE